MKLYLVTFGEYSDYFVHGIYSTKEKAQQEIDRCRGWSEEAEPEDKYDSACRYIYKNHDANDIAEMELDEVPELDFRKVRKNV